MLFFEIVMVSLGAIRANVMRSVLTTLGIVIGIAAVMSMVALGEGAQKRVQAEIDRMGITVLTIRPGQAMMHGVARGDGARMSVDDAIALRADASSRLLVTPEQNSRLQLTYSRWNSSHTVNGVWPEYFDIYDFELEVGRFFNEGEERGRRRVAILGSNVPTNLGETPPEFLLGQTVQLRGIPFEVIGVMKEKGSSMWFRPDDQVFIPHATAKFRVMGGRDRLNGIVASVETVDELDAAFADVDRILRREHRIRPGEDSDFRVMRATDFIEARSEMQRTFTLLLAGIAGVSLLVGGIGIMNIMLVSVTERTREIGVRKALGATRRAILVQFLVEALVLCTLGGLLGVLAGYGGAALMTRLGGWEATVAPAAVATALGFSAAIGLFFGVWPARRASVLDPIDALRYE